MEQLLKSEKLNIDSNSTTASQDWDHWHKTFINFLDVSKIGDEDNKLKLLTNLVTSSVYAHISECPTFNDAIISLQRLYCRPVNEVFARHKLLTRKQQQGENIDQFLEELRKLSKECNFSSVSAETNRDDCIRDAFVSGLLSPQIRQRLLENFELPLKKAYEQARCLEVAQHNANMYQIPATLNNCYRLVGYSSLN